VNTRVIAKHTIYANVGLFVRVAVGINLAGTVKNGKKILLISRVSDTQPLNK
jgi:hypothetical protein